MNLDLFFKKYLGNSDLSMLLRDIFAGVQDISDNIDITKAKTDNWNDSGDQQLEMDVLADSLIHDRLSQSDLVALLASEERPDATLLSGDMFSVVYDPLDGSSLVDANFAIGTIFGVFPGSYVEGRVPKDMVAAAYAVYGPRTSLVLACEEGVFEFILGIHGFELVRTDIRVKEVGKYFAPGNLRACKSNTAYKDLVNYWIDEQYTLRYSGGMVPDINHILCKGEGVFAYPRSAEAENGKLRLLYECGPMAYIVTRAGGYATNGKTDILDLPIASLHQKSPIFIGSKKDVLKVEEFGV